MSYRACSRPAVQPYCQWLVQWIFFCLKEPPEDVLIWSNVRVSGEALHIGIWFAYSVRHSLVPDIHTGGTFCGLEARRRIYKLG